MFFSLEMWEISSGLVLCGCGFGRRRILFARNLLFFRTVLLLVCSFFLMDSVLFLLGFYVSLYLLSYQILRVR